ncbi:MAG: NAD(P)/FAD-dependent oxidoreductase, partial [Candidatus Roizmanbacteria bacterium]
ACATCDGFFFKNKIVAVVGGGDTAMEEALTLTNFATKVYLIHRKDSFRASQIMQDRVKKHEKIEIIYNAEIEEVLGQIKVEGLKLKKTTPEASVPETIQLDGLFLAIGHTPNTEFLKESDVILDEKGYIISSGYAAWEKMKGIGRTDKHDRFNYNFQYATSVEGIFAAGDCVDYLYRQAATAVGMGVAAALEVEKYLFEKRSH